MCYDHTGVSYGILDAFLLHLPIAFAELRLYYCRIRPSASKTQIFMSRSLNFDNDDYLRKCGHLIPADRPKPCPRHGVCVKCSAVDSVRAEPGWTPPISGAQVAACPVGPGYRAECSSLARLPGILPDHSSITKMGDEPMAFDLWPSVPPSKARTDKKTARLVGKEVRCSCW